MNCHPFLKLSGSSLLCAAVPQIVISLWPWHKGPFAGLHTGVRGRGKLILQTELGGGGSVGNILTRVPSRFFFRNKTGNFTWRSGEKLSASIHLSGFMFLGAISCLREAGGRFWKAGERHIQT